ncbi:MAG: amino acid permease [Bacteroidetes bacterium]|nr:amino acid permease [Bacteroidota bacterium]
MKHTKKLNELASTAICGNDISSSCLYVSALAIVASGQYAWIALLVVGTVLFLYRKVYGEVVGALPLNGGAYNALLNTTSKSMASLAATLTLLSYMATAVISANEAMHYAHEIIHALPVIISTVVLLAMFMGLSILGIGESSKVAIAIFIFHLTSLVVLSSITGYHIFKNGLVIFQNNNSLLPMHGSITAALFFGFSAAMLGISGFESSANFVEEQARGVFPKTLRNMWIVVTFFNPLMAFLALATIPVETIRMNQNSLLSFMGNLSGGQWLSFLVSLDAALVLSGAVLTSFVGVTGLVERMTLDRVLPQFLLKKNNRGSSYRISMVFFVLCVSILLITQGDIEALAGVYTIAFLSVMALFGIGNILLKVKRKNLPRPVKSGWISLLIAIAAVLIAIVGQAKLHPKYLLVFLEYFVPTIILVMIMLNRTVLLKFILKLIDYIFTPLLNLLTGLNNKINTTIEDINSQEFVYFTKDDDVATLNRVMLYIKHNEHTKKLKIVAAMEDGQDPSPQFLNDVNVLDREYPGINIEFIVLHEKFGPTLIRKLSKQWNIPINFMFIGSPGDHFPYRIEQLGGVRLII